MSIRSREYVNCSEREILTYLIDFAFVDMSIEEALDHTNSTLDICEYESASMEDATYI